MRLIAKNFRTLSIAVFLLYVFKGFIYEWIEGTTIDNNKFMFIHLNPKIDRLVYWLINDSTIAIAFYLLSYKITNSALTSTTHRAIFEGFKAFCIAELIDIAVVQFLRGGESFNSLFTIGLACSIFLINIYKMKKNVDEGNI